MSELSNLEALKQRKEQLLLEQEVARLERRQNMGKAGSWSWVWVGPLAVIGGGLLITGLFQMDPVPLGLAVLALIPVAMKVYFKR